MSIKKNDVIKLKINAISSEGNGVAKTNEGIAVFVPASAVGDVLMARIVKVLKNYAFGKIEEILEPSADRAEPTCLKGTSCGGCVYSHISYEAELSAKYNRVKDAVNRIAKLDVPINPVLNTGSVSRYRNKAMIPIGISKDGNVIMGFYSKHSHRIVESDDCYLQPLCFLTASLVLKDFIIRRKLSVYNEQTGNGLFRHLYLRLAESRDELMITLVINGDDIPYKDELIDCFKSKLSNLKSVILSVNKEDTNVVLGKKCKTLYGSPFITDRLMNLDFKISPQSFYQVNRSGAEVLYSKAFEYANLSGDEVLLDLYCGTGTIGLCMAHKAKELVGVEIVPKAIEDAKENARANNINNARFICADAAKAAKQLQAEGIKPDVIIIDPPRKGCDNSLIKTIVQFSPSRVVYVSCDAATLSRDLRIFADLGYKTEEVTPVDMFPRTCHVESVALLILQPQVHNMKLDSAPFQMIKNKSKNIELRLYDEKRQKIKAGDRIIFTDTHTDETMTAEVVKLHLFDNFQKLYESLPLLKCGYTPQNVNEAKPSDMEEFYPLDTQKKYKVVGIELCVFEY